MTSRSHRFFITPDEFIELMADVAMSFQLTVLVSERRRAAEFLQMTDVARQDFIASGGGPKVWRSSLYLCHDVRRQLDVALQSGADVLSVFLAEGEVAPGSVDPDRIPAGKLGWLEFGMPRIEENTLYLCHFGLKTDWIEEGSRQPIENPRAVRLFERVWAEIRARLHYPVWCYNILDGSSTAQPNPSLGFTSGLADWISRGGELRQKGVQNIRYCITRPQSD